MDEETRLEIIRHEYANLIEEGLRRQPAERRKLIRYIETIPVMFQRMETQAHSFSLDLGTGGIRILWDEPMAVGEEHGISIAIGPLREWVDLTAKVVWIRPHDQKYEVGLMFTEIGQAEKEKIKRYTEIVSDKLGTSFDETQLSPPGKRRFKRMPRLFLGEIATLDNPDVYLQGLIIEISLGGARFLTSTLIPEKERVLLKIKFDVEKQVLIKGRIVWSHPTEAFKEFQKGLEYIHAISFEEYSPSVHKLLEIHVGYQYSMKELNLVETLYRMLG